ncbi:MAG: energy transducer TonB [Paludibacter sp.]|nr:energy transducer TonB [Paludibacter sp.]
MQQLKLLLFIPMLFVCICSANAQAPVYKSVPVSTDSIRKAKPDLDRPDKNGIYQVIEKMPQFPGGEKALLDFISHNLKYPIDAQEKGIQGRIVVRFVVTKTGKVENVETVRALYPSLDKEGVRVVSTLPDWIPGEQKGEKVSVYYVLPITYKLDGNSKSQALDQAKKPLIILDGEIVAKDFSFATLNKDSISSVDVIRADKKEKLEELATKFSANTENGAIIIVTKKQARLKGLGKSPATNELTYDVVEQMPRYPGGEEALMNYIAKNLKYPVEAQQKGIQGRVILRFVVSNTGKTTKVEVIRSVSPALDAEAVRVVESLPDWIPGKQNGVKVNVYYTLPVSFRLK